MPQLSNGLSDWMLSGRNPLDAACLLDHQNAGCANGVGNMLGANSGKGNIARLQPRHLHSSVLPVMHINSAIQHDKHLFAIVNVPLIGLISPVQASGDAIHVGDVDRTPGAIGFEGFAVDDFHKSERARLKRQIDRF